MWLWVLYEFFFFHWLCVHFNIDFNIYVVFKVLKGLVPSYFANFEEGTFSQGHSGPLTSFFLLLLGKQGNRVSSDCEMPVHVKLTPSLQFLIHILKLTFTPWLLSRLRAVCFGIFTVWVWLYVILFISLTAPWSTFLFFMCFIKKKILDEIRYFAHWF